MLDTGFTECINVSEYPDKEKHLSACGCACEVG